jgi:hypothetical protein
VHCHVLRPFATDLPYKLAKTRLRILQSPKAGMRLRCASFRCRFAGL